MAQGSAVEPVIEDENAEPSAEADVDVDMDVEQQSDLTSLGDPEDDDATIEALLSGSLTPVDQLTPGGEPEQLDEPAQDVQGPGPDRSATSSIARPLKGKRKGRSDSDRGRPKFSEGKEFLPGGTLGEYRIAPYLLPDPNLCFSPRQYGLNLVSRVAVGSRIL